MRRLARLPAYASRSDRRKNMQTTGALQRDAANDGKHRDDFDEFAAAAQPPKIV